ncbi:acyl-CoA desaturase [Dongia sedimenti]|uniref:Acyl-CoA desaturase n=1 Tax=Dongia sedimenti TaxID=3064282 RepID=A0ABU0YHN4_9PROT|nr:acyl-CoA desaturase [Rhodospirillaceae bacterium R-7]
MMPLPESLKQHRVSAVDVASVCDGAVVFAPAKSLWFFGMASAALIGCSLFFTWSGLLVFFLVTGAVLLFGHSLGSHRKLIHNSFACPAWLEYFLVYMGVQVGLSGPLGLMRAHELRDYAQRLPVCHDYLRHGRGFWLDGWWQLNCELRLANPPSVTIEERVSGNRFYRFLEATWMLQQIPPALALYALGGWSFVFFGTCARVTAGVLGHWLIGHFAHNQGGMHFKVEAAAVQGRNIHLTSILTMGECWHNNHHAFPGSARLGLFPGEWDPGWWMLLVFRRFGLAWNFRLPEHIPARAELARVDALSGSLLAPPRYRIDAPRFEPLRLRLLWDRLRSNHGDAPARLEWPASILSERAMRSLFGRKVALEVDPALTLLVLHEGNRSYYGFPAVCMALGRRNRFTRMIALALMPLAVALEAVRQAFAFRPEAV